MGLLPLLDIARSGLLAHEYGLSVIGNNIANVQTPGYTRQRAILASVAGGLGAYGLPVPGGVRVAGLEQLVDGFLDRRRRLATSDASGGAARRDALGALGSLVDEVSNPSLSAAVNDFFDAAEALQRNPAGIAERQQLLARAGAVASELARRTSGVAAQQREADDRVSALVTRANDDLARIADLNTRIGASAAEGPGAASALVDERSRVLQDLAGVLPVEVTQRSDGGINVSAGGATLVDGGAIIQQLGIAAGSPGLDGLPLHQVGIAGAGGTLVGVRGLGAHGELGALLTVRDQDLATAASNLDTFAAAFAGAVNGVQTNVGAVDLDGNPTAGVPLFTGTTAATLAVAIADPRRIAAAGSLAPGDNQNAIALAALRTTAQAGLGNLTFTGWIGGEQTRIAGDVADADAAARSAELWANETEAQHDAVSGVSLEEELTNLLAVQRAFQASSKLVSVADQVLDDLMQMV